MLQRVFPPTFFACHQSGGRDFRFPRLHSRGWIMQQCGVACLTEWLDKTAGGDRGRRHNAEKELQQAKYKAVPSSQRLPSFRDELSVWNSKNSHKVQAAVEELYSCVVHALASPPLCYPQCFAGWVSMHQRQEWRCKDFRWGRHDHWSSWGRAENHFKSWGIVSLWYSGCICWLLLFWNSLFDGFGNTWSNRW